MKKEMELIKKVRIKMVRIKIYPVIIIYTIDKINEKGNRIDEEMKSNTTFSIPTLD